MRFYSETWLIGFLIVMITVQTLAQQELEIPLRPVEAAVIKSIIAAEQLDVLSVEIPAWAKDSVIKSLADHGVRTDSLKASAIANREKRNVFLGFVYDERGHVLALSGNGPWLRNSSLRLLKEMPELRIIRIDHNGFVGRDPRIADFDGTGFDALVDSKLMEVKIGLSFSDAGMEQCAKIKSLRSFRVAHSRVTDAGIKFFAGHPALTEFSIAEMASNRVSKKSLSEIAKIPYLTRVGFGECYVTYDEGLAFLAPLKGQLKQIDLTMSIASLADLDRLKSDHPDAKVITIPPAEIVKRHKFIAANLVKQLPPELAAPLQEALQK
ncbi:MAG: hypothetical protein RLY14_1258 [Planctomycetota bacterium]